MIYDLIPFRIPDLLLKDSYTKASLADYCRQHEYLVHHADKVVTISEYSRREIAKEFGIEECEIPVVPCGVNAQRFASHAEGDATESEVKAKYGLPDRFVLYLGTTATYKNVENLIRGYARMSDVIRRNVGLVVTHGNDRLERVAREEGVVSRVKFLGFVQETDKPALYRLASAYGFLSRIEGFGLTPLEAMAAGVPTLVSNCATLPEVVGDGALIVGPDDISEIASALERMLEDRALCAGLVARGRERAAKFTWDNAVLKMAKVIDDI
jgi:glycosyltransferase involved in cell wall biosynthesis